MKIERVQAYRLSIPFIEETVVPYARHRVVDSVILRIFAGDCEGISEVTGNVGYSGESAGVILEVLNHIVPNVLGMDPRQIRLVHEEMEKVIGNHAAKAGIDLACHDLVGKALGVPAGILLGGIALERAQTHRLMPIKPVDEMVRFAREMCEVGYRHFELKVEGNPDADIERVTAVRAAMTPDSVIIMDANRGFTVANAIRLLSALEPGNLYMEQPVGTVREMAEVRRRTRIPLVADEMAKSFPDVIHIIESGAADAISIKLAKLGGLLPAMQVASYLEAIGVPFRVDDMCQSRLANTATYVFSTAWKHVLTRGFAQFQLLVNHDSIVTGGVEVSRSWGRLEPRPGLGGTINLEALGAPVAEWRL